ncbi:MAG: type IV pilus secretin PilQ [Candidatus Desulfofervidaceae bacterium]|nr:type IV pilus secretin PilQ [Candidatus Desulfofervidaceae bacterium]
MCKKLGKKYLIKFLGVIFCIFISCAPKQAVIPSSASLQSPKKARITSIKVDSEKGRKILWTIHSTAPLTYTVYELLNPLRLIIEIPGAELSPGVKSLEVDNWGIKNIEVISFPQDNMVQLVAYLKTVLHRDVYFKDNGLTVVFTPIITPRVLTPGPVKQKALPKRKEPPSKPALSKKTRAYPRTPVSLDFEQADLKMILKWMAEEAGLNIIFGPKVKGRVSIHLVDVPWDKAFQSILDSHGLVATQMDNLIRVITSETYEKEKKKELNLRRIEAEVKKMELEEQEQEARLKVELRTKLKVAQKITQPLVTWMQPVYYLDIEELKKNLEPYLTRDLEGKPYGFIQVNKDKNALIICDVEENVRQIVALIKQLDVKIPQVMIEARIVEMSEDYEKELGIQWGATGQIGSVKVSGEAENTIVNIPLPTQSTPTGGLGLTFSKLSGAPFDIEAKLLALESQGRVKILSSPRIATMDNKEAVIESGRRIPYQELVPFPGTTEAYPTLSWIDALLSLKIKPHIVSPGLIKMDILASKEEADFTKTVLGAPTIIKKKAKTTLLVKNGETVVIGGLYKENRTKEEKSVPWFRKIPLFGYFFRGKHKLESNEELLIFITPRILRE